MLVVRTTENSVLSWLARLHPAWMWLLLFVACCLPAMVTGHLFGAHLAAYSDRMQPYERVLAVSSILVPISYALFVTLVTSGRFRSQRERSIRGPLVAFGLVAVAITTLYALFPWTDRDVEALNQTMGLLERIALATGVLAATTVYFYVFYRSVVDLVDAERGAAGRLGRKVGTAFLLLYWFIGVVFIQKRLRCLLRNSEGGNRNELPLEKLEIQRQASGHLSLLLTERVSGEGFEDYAAELLHRLDGRLVKRVDGPDIHVWDVEVETTPLQLVFDDFPFGVTLESRSYPGDTFLKRLQARLGRAS